MFRLLGENKECVQAASGEYKGVFRPLQVRTMVCSGCFG